MDRFRFAIVRISIMAFHGLARHQVPTQQFDILLANATRVRHQRRTDEQRQMAALPHVQQRGARECPQQAAARRNLELGRGRGERVRGGRGR